VNPFIFMIAFSLDWHRTRIMEAISPASFCFYKLGSFQYIFFISLVWSGKDDTLYWSIFYSFVEEKLVFLFNFFFLNNQLMLLIVCFSFRVVRMKAIQIWISWYDFLLTFQEYCHRWCWSYLMIKIYFLFFIFNRCWLFVHE